MTVYAAQPSDADLDAIAALATTAFGRSLLAAANAGAALALLGTGTPSSSTFLRGDATWATPPSDPPATGVTSVNGETGDVTLTAAEVGADATGSAAAAQAASQPVDSDLTAIAALTTTAFGRSFLALADAAAGRTLLGLGTAATQSTAAFDTAGSAAAAQAASQPLDADLTAIAALTTTAIGRSLLAAADAAAIRTIAGAQASDTDLTAIAALVSAADKVPYATGAGTWALADFGTFARGLLALTTASSTRDYLGLTIGSAVQPYDAKLAAITSATWAGDKVLYLTGTNTVGVADFTTFGRSIAAAADAAAARTLLALGSLATVTPTGTPDGTKFLRDDFTWQPASGGSTSVANDAIWQAAGDLAVGTGASTAARLAKGTASQYLRVNAGATALEWATFAITAADIADAELAALAGLTSAADRLPYFSGSGSASLATFTGFGRSLVDDADASTARTTLGLVIGANVQAQNSNLQGFADITTTSYGRSFSTVADAAAARTYIGSVIGTDVLAYSAKVQAFANLTGAADKLAYFTGSATLTTTDLSSFSRTLLDDTTASAWLTTLGVSAYAKTILDDTDAATTRTTLGAAAATDLDTLEADFAAHVDETDPFVHTAAKLSSDSTVGTGNVEDDLSQLDSEKATTTYVDSEVDGIATLLTAAQQVVGLVNQGDAYHLEDDFDSGGLTSGTIGTHSWLRTAPSGATSVKTASVPNHPGILTVGTGGTSGNVMAVYLTAAAETVFDPDMIWRLFWFARAASFTNASFRVGLSSDPTTETPVEGIYFEKLNADTNLFTVIRKASSDTRVDTAVAPSANGWYRFGVSRGSATGDVVFALRPAAGSETTWTSSAPGTFAALIPFIQIRTHAATTKTVDVDRYEQLLQGIVR